MGAIVLVQILMTARLIGAEKTVFVPPEIKRSFWVSGSAVSKEYLEEMAYWYAGLALNITPVVSDYQNNLFLTYAAPSEYGRLQAEMGARAEFLKKNNTATQFAVRSVTTDEKKTARGPLGNPLYLDVGQEGRRAQCRLHGWLQAHEWETLCLGLQGNFRSGSFWRRCCWQALRRWRAGPVRPAGRDAFRKRIPGRTDADQSGRSADSPGVRSRRRFHSDARQGGGDSLPQAHDGQAGIQRLRIRRDWADVEAAPFRRRRPVR